VDTPNKEDEGYSYVEYVHNEIIKRVPSKAVYAFGGGFSIGCIHSFVMEQNF
jgi:hypothetical protein